MKAIVYHEYGEPEVLQEVSLPDPEPGPGEILVRVAGAGVNPVDSKARSGSLRLLTMGRFPRIPGADFSGEVVQLGRGATRFRIGEKVFGMLSGYAGGAYAGLVRVPQSDVAIAPVGIPLAHAASVPLAGMTALQSLRDKGKIKSNLDVLINGASGGVGSFAVQIAKIYQCRVTGVASGRNEGLVKQLGADAFIDYTMDDFTRADEQFDIVFDCASTSSFEACDRILKSGGSYITLLPNPSAIFHMALTAVFGSKKCHFGSVRCISDDLDSLRQYIQGKTIKPAIERTMPLAEAAEAHRLTEDGHTRGKIVLTL